MILSDSELIINTQGIRYVHHWDNIGVIKYWLGVQYKGCCLNHGYESRELRDNMFNRLQKEMEKNK